MNDYIPCLDALCLVPRPHYSARPMRFGSRGPIENVTDRPPRIRHRNELTERDWENAVQGLGKDALIKETFPTRSKSQRSKKKEKKKKKHGDRDGIMYYVKGMQN